MAERKTKFDLSGERAMTAAMQTNSAVNGTDGSGQPGEVLRPTDIRLLPLTQLRNSPFNGLFEINDIATLAEKILQEGLLENIVVRPLPDGNYEIISGHRRVAACRSLLDQGNKEFYKISCSIKHGLSDAEAERALIDANLTTRELTIIVRSKAAARLAELFEDDPTVTGKTRDAVAAELNVSARTAQSLISIDKKMIPELKTIIDEKGVSLRDATTIAALPEESQRDILDLLTNGGNNEDLKAQINELTENGERTKKAFERQLREESAKHKESLRKLELQLEEEKGKKSSEVQHEARLYMISTQVRALNETAEFILGQLNGGFPLNNLDNRTIDALRKCRETLDSILG